jgi:2-polyprenyl-3-methyl-5-hydroxy-6-metoxy-1,4-benzoquinol methylase
MSDSTESDYQARLREEIEHYTRLYDDEQSRQQLTQSVPASWNYVEGRAWRRIKEANEGRSSVDEVLHHLRRCGGGRILSVGSGPGGQEIAMAKNLRESGTTYEVLCLDVNPNLIALGQERANAEGLNIGFRVQDMNHVDLSKNAFDVIMCFSSLHHLISLEHVFSELHGALKPDGELVVVDIVTRNGYFMWDETLEVVRALWRILPEQFKFNFTSYEKPQIDEEYRNLDYGADDMECARSQDILPLLAQYFEPITYVPYFSICRRFFDTKYGPCYDLSKPLDKAIVDFIWNLDVHYLSTGKLKPETFFGVYVKGQDRSSGPALKVSEAGWTSNPLTQEASKHEEELEASPHPDGQNGGALGIIGWLKAKLGPLAGK